MRPTPTIHRQYLGYWCSNCETVWPIKWGGHCRDYGGIELQPMDVVLNARTED